MTESAVVHVDALAESRLFELLAKRCDPRWYVDVPVYAPWLIALVHEAGGQSIAEFSDLIRRVVTENSRLDHGDNRGEYTQSLARHVKLLIDVLEKMRRELSTQGHWSALPVPPLMCG